MREPFFVVSLAFPPYLPLFSEGPMFRLLLASPGTAQPLLWCPGFLQLWQMMLLRSGADSIYMATPRLALSLPLPLS